jgi:hypothetical protein
LLKKRLSSLSTDNNILLAGSKLFEHLSTLEFVEMATLSIEGI